MICDEGKHFVKEISQFYSNKHSHKEKIFVGLFFVISVAQNHSWWLITKICIFFQPEFNEFQIINYALLKTFQHVRLNLLALPARHINRFAFRAKFIKKLFANLFVSLPWNEFKSDLLSPLCFSLRNLDYFLSSKKTKIVSGNKEAAAEKHSHQRDSPATIRKN